MTRAILPLTQPLLTLFPRSHNSAPRAISRLPNRRLRNRRLCHSHADANPRGAADGGTIGLEVSFAAFLAVILGLFIPVVFLVTLYIQSEAQGTATSFRNPDSSGGQRFDDPAL